jgi:hypothetical protein
VVGCGRNQLPRGILARLGCVLKTFGASHGAASALLFAPFLRGQLSFFFQAEQQ